MTIIRLLHPSDEAEYASMWCKALIEQSSYFRIALEDNPAQPIPTKFTSESFTLGVFDNQKIKGSVSIEFESRLRLKHKALLFKMFVHPDLSGKNVGHDLIRAGIEMASGNKQLKQIYLTVLANNSRAIHLYNSIGFVKFAHELQAVNINGSYVDEFQMVYFLSNSV